MLQSLSMTTTKQYARDLLLALAILATLLAQACSLPGSLERETMNDDAIVLEANVQLTVGDLRIGVGNIWEENYTDSSGNGKKGLTAALWLFYRTDQSLDVTPRVHAGQEIIIGRYAIKIIDVVRDRDGGFVRLQVYEDEKRVQ